MMYTCIIADDEPLAHKVLLDHINRAGTLRIVKQAYSAAEARSEEHTSELQSR